MVSPQLLHLRFLTLLLCTLLTGAEPDLSSDRTALLAFRDTVGPTKLRWNATDTPCAWQGVGCLQSRVVFLRLPAIGLIGVIPAGTIGNLTALRTLSLRFNGLSGSFPEDLLRAAQLRNLYLQDNRYSGEIPAALFSLRKLVHLNLAGNGFTGEISPTFSNLSRLRTLYLERNQLSGSIPDLFLPKLEQLNVSLNRLNGSVPLRFWKMPASAFIGMSLCGGSLRPCSSMNSTGLASADEGPGPPGAGGGGGGSGGSKLSGGAIAGIVVGSVAVLILLIILLLFVCRWTRRRKTREVEAASVSVKPPDVASRDRERGEATVVRKKHEMGKRLVFFGMIGVGEFDLEDLLRASAEVLGKGTFGTVYKAVLDVGAVVAVKRLRDVNLAEEGFRKKIEAVGSMGHENLVPLRAYYYSKDEKLLIYDYMPMGSLSAMLHGNRGSVRTHLSWETRFSIARSAARGIEYIHSTSPTASHGNIKSSNILLTKSHNGCVSDHGLASLVGPNTSLSRFSGYRAPEVTDIRKVSQKADVYSFGVLLLELLTGKAPSHDHGIDLPQWVESVVREEWSTEVFDLELIRQQNVEEELVHLLHLAIECTAKYPDSRPSMQQVMARIEGIRSSSGGDSIVEERVQNQIEPSGNDGANDMPSQRTVAGADS